MTYSRHGVRCEYMKNVFDGQTVVLLHGWGGDIRSFYGVYDYLTRCGIAAVNISFPREVPSSWGVYDYADYVKSLMAELNLSSVTLVGHSFGGRVAIILASYGVCDSLMLVDAAGIRPRGIKRAVRNAFVRLYKRLGRDTSVFASTDYRVLSNEMKPVFSRIVSQDLSEAAEKISVPTLIVWGRTDKDTPMYMARKLKKLIVGSELAVLDGGHYSYIDCPNEFKSLLTSFILR